MEIDKILQRLNIDKLNAMQEAAWECDTDDRDMVLLSPTGSGKTIAYLLPLLRSLRPDTEGVQAVILVPSRELAIQTETVFKSMDTPFRVMSCYGGRPAMDEHRTMNGVRPSVIVGTPGRMNDHLNKRNFDAASVRYLVIDEFDKCLEFGFHEEMSAVIGQLPNLHKRYLLSATDAEEIPQFTGLNQPLRLNYLGGETDSINRIHRYKVLSPEKDKLGTLYDLLCTLGAKPSIVFCNYRESVDRISGFLSSKGISHEAFHGGMEQDKRERALYKFRNGSCSVFVSTDLAARGLDIPDIENIIHYHLPVNEEGYIHRNGRTARWNANGNSYLILHPEEVTPDYCGELEEFRFPSVIPKPTQPEWATIYIGKGKKDKLNKVDIVGFLYKKGNLQRDDVGRVDVKDHYSFVAVKRKKLKQTFNLIRGEKIKGIKTIIEEIR